MMIKFWGTRGSIPVPGKNTIRYGGNTPCIEVRSEGKTIMIDCGTGFREAGNYFSQNGSPDEIHVMLSHYHWDHIQGIPFFKPLYSSGKKIVFYGMKSRGKNIKQTLSFQMSGSYFPITLKELKSELLFKEIKPGKKYKINGFEIETLKVAHPSPTLTYKFTCNDKCFVYMTDNEINLNTSAYSDKEFLKKNKKLIEFCSMCDYLIHDSMYDEKSVFEKKGWGHSSNISLARFGILAQIKNLVLFHYNPDYTDEKIDQLLSETKKCLKENNSSIQCIAASEGLEITF